MWNDELFSINKNFMVKIWNGHFCPLWTPMGIFKFSLFVWRISEKYFGEIHPSTTWVKSLNFSTLVKTIFSRHGFEKCERTLLSPWTNTGYIDAIDKISSK